MAMACAFTGLVSTSTLMPASSSTASQGRRDAVGRAPTTRQGFVVKSAQNNDISRESRSASRREVISLATLSVLLLSTDKAQAKDIPLFGIRKQLEKAEKAVEGAGQAVENEVKELAKQGGKELEAVSASVQGVVDEASASPSPLLQAGGVAGVEVVAVLAAATVVNGLVSVPSK